MKNPKKLTRVQKEKLSKKHFISEDYVVIKEDAYTFTVQKKTKIGTDSDIFVFNK